MKVAYFDAFSGASGDMILGALLDAGLDLRKLEAALTPLGVGELRLEACKESRLGIQGTRFIVHAGQGQSRSHRSWADIRRLLERADLPGRTRQRAIDIFSRLAAAEAAVHGTSPEAVHFHEVGAVDSIVDIVGAAAALELLAIECVYCSPLPTGCGTVSCDHGTFPVPAPATAELLRGVPIAPSAEEGELTTPTGAAILTTLAAAFGPLPAMTIQAVGYGAGSRQGRALPNLLRVFVGELAAESGSVAGVPALEADTVWVIETNLDDTTAEVVADAAQRLLAAGALDVYTVPITMKKGRSGLLLACLAHEAERLRCEQVIFEHTGTFGLRRYLATRSMLRRRHQTVRTRYGEVRVKLGLRGDEVVRAAPEFEDCRRAAEAAGVSVQEVMREALRLYGAAEP